MTTSLSAGQLHHRSCSSAAKLKTQRTKTINVFMLEELTDQLHRARCLNVLKLDAESKQAVQPLCVCPPHPTTPRMQKTSQTEQTAALC